MDITLRGDHTGEFSRGLVYQGLVKALETGHLSLWELCYRNLQGGAPLLRDLMVMKGRLLGWATLFMGARLGKLEWTQLLGTLRYG